MSVDTDTVLETIAEGDEPFTTAQVVALSGCTYRQIDYWCRSGLITSHELSDLGSGRQRAWTVVDLLEAVIIGRLAHAGIDISLIRDLDISIPEFAQRIIDDLRDVVDLASILAE